MKETIFHAIDIGTTKVAALAARRTEYGKIEILGLGNSPSFGVARGVVTNIDKTVHAIKKAVEEAERQSGTKFSEVEVGIAGSHIKSMQNRGIRTREDSETEISKEDIDLLVQDMYKLSVSPSDKILHVLPQEFIVDNERGITDPVGMAGVRLEGNFHIITGEVTAIKNIKRCIELAGLKVANIVLEPLASAAAVLSAEEIEAGVALVDIGGGTTDIAIFQDGIIRHTAVIPFGGKAITEDIKKGFMILLDQAENLKVKFGTAFPMDNQDNECVSIPSLRGRDKKEVSIKNLSLIIQARMEEILEQVQYEIKSSGYESQLVGGIVLTGGGSQLKYICQLASLISGLDARQGAPNEHLSASRMRDLHNPIYATGIGLAIRAFDELESQQELEEIKKRKLDGHVSNHAPLTTDCSGIVGTDDIDTISASGSDLFSDPSAAEKEANEREALLRKKAGEKKLKRSPVKDLFGKILNYLEGDFQGFK
jgi:cell division protein FtsA